MEDRAQSLRRLIATYRRSLAEGVDSGEARRYLQAIREAEAELARIEAGKQR